MGSDLVPIEYRGELVALASARRFHIVAPWLATREVGDAELRFVAYMCLFFSEIAAGRLRGPFSSELAERWSRLALIDPEELASNPSASEAELAVRLNVPTEQVRLARLELGSGD